MYYCFAFEIPTRSCSWYPYIVLLFIHLVLFFILVHNLVSFMTSWHNLFTSPRHQQSWYWLGTPLFKSNRNFFCNVKCWYLFSMYRFEIFRVAWWGLLQLLWKISWVYVTASRLCEHSNLVRFEKCAVETPQHGLRYGTILMLYDIINTYEWFFCYNWHQFCSSNKL